MIESEGQQWNIWHEKYREADVIRTEIAALDAKIQNIADVVKDENPVKQMKYFNEWLTKNNEYNHLVGYGRIDLSTAVQQIPDSFECTAALSGWTGDAGPVCETYFLIGSQTETQVGSSKMKFIESHPENNRLFTDGVIFLKC